MFVYLDQAWTGFLMLIGFHFKSSVSSIFVSQSISPSIRQSINQSINQSISQASNQSVSHFKVA